MSYRLSGVNPLAYMGVEPSQPPQMLIETRSPTINDRAFNIGTYWFIASPPPTTNWELWILADLSQGIATWLQLYPTGGPGVDQFDEDVGIAVPNLGIVQVKGGENINTVGNNLNKITINLNESIHLPNTSSDGSQGVLFLGATGGVGGNPFLHNYGFGNTFLGNLAGNLTLTVINAQENVGLGDNSLNALVDGALNVSVGAFSQSVLTNGNLNSSLGTASLSNLVSGLRNLALGQDSGSAYTTNESDNIILANPGVVGESDTIRIGVEATQTAAYMAGIYGQAVGVSEQTVIIDNTGKLGSMVTPPPPAGSQAFLGYQPTNTGIVIGGNPLPPYLLGSSVAFTTLFDVSGGFFPGDGLGAPATFTAPITGIYYLQVQVILNNTDAIKTFEVWPLLQIITPSTTYQNNFTIGPGGAVGGSVSIVTQPPIQTSTSLSTLANLTAGDVVTFQVNLRTGGPVWQVGGAAYPLTFICGNLV